MTEDGGPDALSFAFVAIVRGRAEAWTMGMHVLGLPDVVMKRDEAEADDFDIVEVIRYLARGEKPVGDGHILADLNGPRFQAFAQAAPGDLRGSPMHNPFGRLKLVSVRDIAEAN
jgi:phage terminase Nu1 subunit (DNA packaging protein)